MFNTSILTLLILLSFSQPFSASDQTVQDKQQENEGIETRFYDSMNQTVVSAAGLPEFKPAAGDVKSLQIHAYYYYAGKTPTIPEKIGLGFSIEPCKNFESATIWVNGEQVYNGTLMGGVCVGNQNHQTAAYNVEMSLAIFDRIASGENVEVEIDHSRVKLAKEHVDAFLKLSQKISQ
jgi:hypothetical protein